MGFKVKVKDIDRGYKGIRAGIAAIGGAEVKAGVFGEKGQAAHGKDGPSVVDIAMFHEFGTSKVPERSFLRASFDSNRAKYDGLLAELERAIYTNQKMIRGTLDVIGATMAADMRARVRSNIPPALKPATIARKMRLGRKDPTLALVDTRQLINAISHQTIFGTGTVLGDKPGGGHEG